MTQLHRISTQYDPDEDRIRLTGTDDSGHTLILWLTQRLLNRLMSHLCQGLEKMATQAGKKSPAAGQDLRAHMEQSFAQQKAKAELPRQSPVKPAADAPQWRVDAVDVKHGANGVRIVLKGAVEGHQATLTLPTPMLRQWLGIVFEQYRRAGWAAQVWPAWMEEAAAPASKAVAGALH